MSEKIRWGILGCGHIANKFAADLKLVEDAVLLAVASRDKIKAKEFSERHQAHFAFGSYEELVTFDQIDAIYVATPHGLHHDHVLLCLNHRKAVLCEKAFALNARQLKEMIQVARKKQVFMMEAFWTKFLPQYQKMKSLIEEGTIGDIKMIQADFGFNASERLTQRLYDPVLGGGALLDIGIYPVFLALSLLGRPTEIFATMAPFSSGVDEQIAIAMKFETGALASMIATFSAHTPVEAIIVGTEGYIRMSNRFYSATSNVELTKNAAPTELIPVHREDGFGYQFEARHFGECLRKNLKESPIMSHADSLLLMETLDRVRACCGIRYAVDETK
jgi:predicted dehydrogenase